MHDLVIRGGTLVDGTGRDAVTADVAVADGKIVDVGKVDGAATRVIDADGALVTPGFVDIHAHYDGQATWDSHLAPSSWHGVTTVVMGNCGVGFAPVRPADRGVLVELMEGVEDIPGAALHEGVTWQWESYPDYLDAVAAKPRDIDVCALVPHGAVRLYVMGERAARREAATPDDIASMGQIVAEGVEAGAFGFSTSRTLNHRTSTGDLTPTIGAAAHELAGIARAMAATGRGVFEVVSDYETDDEFEAFRQVAELGVRTFLSLNQNKAQGYRRVLDQVASAARAGLPMTAQVAVRPIGLIFGLETSVNPFIFNPVWREIGHGDLTAKLRALADDAIRTRLREAADQPGHGFGDFAKMFPIGDRPDYEPPPEASIAAIAERSGRHPVDVAVETMLADDGAGFIYYPIFNYDSGDLEAQRALLEHPDTVIGLADGGAHVGTICDGSFPTTLLAHWGRDRTRGPKLPLPWLVKAQTADTAAAYGLHDRGRIEVGCRADVNVIDFDRLNVGPPRLVADLPAGGKRLLQRADGYIATIVRGEVTYENGEPTGVLPGRLVRSGAARG